MPTKVGVLGVGIGKFAIEGVLRLADEDVELAVVCDKDPAKWSVVEGVYRQVMADRPELNLSVPEMEWKSTQSWKAAIEQFDLDAVIIALPTSLHAEVTIAALEAGLHVLCEKPMANSLVAAGQMLAAAKAKPDLITMMVMNNLLRDHYLMMLKMLETGELGEIQSIRAWWLRSLGRPFRGSDFTSKEKSGAGPAVDLGVHLLYMILRLLNWQEPQRVTGFTRADFTAPYRGEGPYGGGTKTPDAPLDVEDSAEAIFVFKLGTRVIPVTVEVSWVKNIPAETMGLTIYGTNTSTTMERNWLLNNGDDNDSIDSLVRFGHRPSGDKWYNFHTELDTNREPTLNDVFMGRVPMAQHFVRCVQGRETPIATFDQAFLAQQMLKAWLVSAAEEREVLLADI